MPLFTRIRHLRHFLGYFNLRCFKMVLLKGLENTYYNYYIEYTKFLSLSFSLLMLSLPLLSSAILPCNVEQFAAQLLL
jgi:hypothetical protein